MRAEKQVLSQKISQQQYVVYPQHNDVVSIPSQKLIAFEGPQGVFLAKWIQLLFYAPHFIATCMEMELNFFPPFFSSTKKITIDIGSSRPVSRESFRLLKIGLKLLLLFKKQHLCKPQLHLFTLNFAPLNYIPFSLPLPMWSLQKILI